MESFLLLIDNESSIPPFYKQVLDLNGYKVFTAETLEKGINILQQNKDKIKVIILNTKLPGADFTVSLPLLRLAKPNIKIIGLGSVNEKIDLTGPVGSSFSSFLQKPFSVESLMAELSKV